MMKNQLFQGGGLTMEDGLELLIGERIGDVLNECRSRKKAHYEEEQRMMEAVDDENRERLEGILEDVLEWGYEDCRTAYCAGMEDGIRIARKVLSV